MRRVLIEFFDAYARQLPDPTSERITMANALPFVVVHLGVLGVFWTGASAVAVWTAVALYLVRMFGITGFYHRYFAHKSFRAGRAVQFAGAVLGCAAAQRGPLWWASHHRYHHQHADRPDDAHSPTQHGLLWSHTGWFLADRHVPTLHDRIRDFARYPELVWLDRFHVVVPLALLLLLFVSGALLQRVAPSLHTSGLQLVVWGFCISTVLVYHATYTINSLSHLIGRRRYATPDTSRNNWLLALLTLGEGWHNNHHHYPICARQGFFWWEYDPTYYVLVVLRAVGLVQALTPLSTAARARGRIRTGAGA